jgi:3-deoxy-D-manno-octulosonic-acid transferase
MLFLYHSLIFLLLPLILPWLMIKLARRRHYAVNFSERFGNIADSIVGGNGASALLRDSDHAVHATPHFWLHAVSAGEVTAAIPLVAAIRARYIPCYITISTATPAGRAVLAASQVAADRIFYSPFDLAWVVRRVVAKVAPTMFLIVETDLWPALLQCLARHNVPSVLVNGRISQRRVQFRFFFRRVFGMLNHICVQTEVDAERLAKIGVESGKISVTGNLKFAQALGQLAASPPGDKRLQLPPGAVLLIAGSTHPGEEEEVLECYRRLRRNSPEVFLMIAPRHLERLAAVEGCIQKLGYVAKRWSAFDGWRRDHIVLVDSLGNLPRLYSMASFVFVGGSFIKRGGHNLLEPAAWGKPIFFGPHMENYSSIAETTEREGAAIRVRSGAELASHIERLVGAPEDSIAMGQRAYALVTRNQGAVDRDMAIIDKLLSRGPSRAKVQTFTAEIAPKVLGIILTLQWLWELSPPFPMDL